MEDAVAHAREGGGREEHRVAARRGVGKPGEREDSHARAQNAHPAEAIDREARERLAHAGHDEEDVVMIAPTCVNESPKSRMSHGKSGGMTKWKKCEVPCAKPTREMTVASRRSSDTAGTAAVADKDRFGRG